MRLRPKAWRWMPPISAPTPREWCGSRPAKPSSTAGSDMRVLVTRPQPGASRTMRRLRELGFEPLLLPLTETVGLPVGADAASDNAVAVAATSANAVRHAPKELIGALAALPCHAV